MCEGRCILQPAALKAPRWNLIVWCRTCARGGGDLFSTASGPVSTVLRRSGGSILVLVRDLALYAALLCCCGPRPHDPRRCGLNSCPSHTPMPCAILPQFANFLGISSVLPLFCIGSRSTLELWSPPLPVVPRVGGLGNQIFSRLRKDAAFCSQRCLRHHTGNSVAPHACGVVEA